MQVSGWKIIQICFIIRLHKLAHMWNHSFASKFVKFRLDISFCDFIDACMGSHRNVVHRLIRTEENDILSRIAKLLTMS